MLAFIGPNESGKSSFLRALSWFSDFDAGPLAVPAGNRSSPPGPKDAVVTVEFSLDDADMAAINLLDIDATAESIALFSAVRFRRTRHADGTYASTITPSLIHDLQEYDSAFESLDSLEIQLSTVPFEEAQFDFRNQILAVISSLKSAMTVEAEGWEVPEADVIAQLRSDAKATFDSFSADFPESPIPEIASHGFLLAEGPIERAHVASQKVPPDQAVRNLLATRMPRFVLFAESDRDLPSIIDFNEGTQTSKYNNLLSVGGTSAFEILEAIRQGQSALRTLQRRVNKELALRLSGHWSQSNLEPQILINGSGLVELNIEDVDGVGQVTEIGERSDGLKAFLSLILFLLANDLADRPSILLIDEAERNLHYDAQGDLIRLLTNNLPVQQVLYTTHSPGCLPLDLGTGIRVVSRVENEPLTSELRNNFWTQENPGLSRLLYAMGAEAAAFSALNKAVLTEGVSEMMLLPRLLRAAAPDKAIDFQVTFGLANLPVTRELGNVAIRTVYLVDGDAGGDKKISALRKLSIPDSHLLQLPKGFAIEDLLDRDFYLDIVDAFIRSSGEKNSVDRTALDPSMTVAKAVDHQAKVTGAYKAPGHKLVASHIGSMPDDVKLSEEGIKYLAAMWSELEAAFTSTYQIRD